MCVQRLTNEEPAQTACGGVDTMPSASEKRPTSSTASIVSTSSSSSFARPFAGKLHKACRMSRNVPASDQAAQDEIPPKLNRPLVNAEADQATWRVPMLVNGVKQAVPGPIAPGLSPAVSEISHPCFFLNMWLLDQPVKDVVKEQAFKELSSVPLPLRGFAAEFATKIVTKSMATAKMGQEFPIELQATLAGMGIDTKVEEVYRQGVLLVVRVKVVHVNVGKLVSTKVSKDTARKVNWVVEHGESVASRFGIKDKIAARSDRVVCPKIVARLCDALPQELPKKMAEKKPGLSVQIIARSEAAQAQYFFDTVHSRK